MVSASCWQVRSLLSSGIRFLALVARSSVVPSPRGSEGNSEEPARTRASTPIGEQQGTAHAGLRRLAPLCSHALPL